MYGDVEKSTYIADRAELLGLSLTFRSRDARSRAARMAARRPKKRRRPIHLAVGLAVPAPAPRTGRAIPPWPARSASDAPPRLASRRPSAAGMTSNRPGR